MNLPCSSEKLQGMFGWGHVHVPMNFCARTELFRKLCEIENGSRAETV